MRECILEKLDQIEQDQHCRILLAVESGSRAWGFASPDSDYDVRFIYVRPREAYLRLEPLRDVIELPVNPVLDINGWDLQKTLRLLHKSNPTVFEWFSSPIVYRSSSFVQTFQPLMEQYFCAKSGLWHYLSMAKGNSRDYLQGELVKAKKYFYVLRPILACRWILHHGTPPPMRFAELMEQELEEELMDTVKGLLAQKMAAPEVKQIPQIQTLNAYIARSVEEIEAEIQALPPEQPKGWEALDRLFLSEMKSK